MCIRDRATEIQIAAEHILKTKKKLNEILAANSGKPVEVVEKDKMCIRDRYLWTTWFVKGCKCNKLSGF